MAPLPEHDKEQKPPDKSHTHSDLAKTENKSLIKINNQVWEPKPGPSHADNEYVEIKETKVLKGMDDGALRALLDEAINYKNPKDREGKSLLFKELLEEVEQDEEGGSGGGGLEGVAAWRAREARGGSRRLRRGQGHGLPHSGSLQDLVAAALAGEPVRRPRTAVSARALHGGSLPSGVDTYPDEHYIATVRCVNPPPLTPPDIEMELLGRSKVPRIPVTYTTCATLEIGAGGQSRALTTTTSSSQVDSGISFGCITTPVVQPSCSTSLLPRGIESTSEKSGGTQYGTVKSDGESSKDRRDKQYQTCLTIQPTGVITTTINGLATITRASYSTATEEYKKSFDENGNAVASTSRTKTLRRKKVSKNETVAMSDQIDGYQGNKELEELLRFIESNPEQSKSKPSRVKHHDDDKATKKRSVERRKDKHEPQRANSMEELSLTKLEDLTGGSATNTVVRKVKKHSVGDAEPYIEQSKKKGKSSKSEPTEEGEFQTVTKRKKSRRARRAGSPPLPARPPSARSLPPPTTKGGCNKQNGSNGVSYAEMARLSRTIPDLIESCHASASPDPTPPPTVAQPGAPPDVLPATKVDRRPPVILQQQNSEENGNTTTELAGITFGFDINHQLLQNGPPPLSSSWEFPEISSTRGRRGKSTNKHSSLPTNSPPSLVNGSTDLDRSDLTDLDHSTELRSSIENLVNNNSINESTNLNSTILNSSSLNSSASFGSTPTKVSSQMVRADLSLTYRPPTLDVVPNETIVHYVASSWEDIIRNISGKVRYYTE